MNKASATDKADKADKAMTTTMDCRVATMDGTAMTHLEALALSLAESQISVGPRSLD